MSVRMMRGHVLDRLRELAGDSVHVAVTSPPYWGLRDYKIPPQVWGGEPGCEHDFDTEIVEGELRKGLGMAVLSERYRGGGHKAGEINNIKAERGCCRHCGAWRGSLGLEPTPQLYIDHLVEVFRAVRRVLRRDGSLWLNIGDSYSAHPGQRKETDKAGPKQRSNTASTRTASRCVPTIKPKDLIGIPWMLAFALRDDGWWLRSEITWAKRAPMPESCTDRPTSATEKVFLLTKSARYFYDNDAVKEPMEDSSLQRLSQPNIFGQPGGPKDPQTGNRSNRKALNNQAERLVKHEKWKTRFEGWDQYDKSLGRNMRNWWLIGPSPYPEAHFATFPPEVPRRAILAGTSERGVCAHCGAPWARVVEKRDTGRKQKMADGWETGPGSHRTIHPMGREAGATGVPVTENITIGWRPTCRCTAEAPIAGTVLDPFLGSGTTALVADRLGRNCIGIELSPDYAAMARRRLEADAPLFLDMAAE
jgi:DNA modification methylase